MAMSGFICHDDYLQKTAKLTDEEVGRLFRALMHYHATGVVDEVDGRESIAFDFIREDIDRTEAAYKAKCEKNRNNRLSALTNVRQQPPTNVDERAQKEKEKEKEKDKDKDKESKPPRRFTPPTVEEVRAYCTERKNGIDPAHFVDYYAARGWELKPGQKVKDWKACVRTWEQRQKTPTIPTQTKTVVAQQYSQRDYSGEEESVDDMMRRLGCT